MNYRHAYHAGGFADVLKHIVLTLVIEHLKRKPAPFRVIDTHAGSGRYDLHGEHAGKTGEWREGIGRLVGPEAQSIEEHAVRELLAPYLAVITEVDARARVDAEAGLGHYPGSPLFARGLLRQGDHLVANELHPADGTALRRLFARDAQVTVLGLDGWVALKSLLPPRERRGLILVDPPFEVAGELERLADGLDETLRRFATGTLLLWYPIKDLKGIDSMHTRMRRIGVERLGPDKLMRAELTIKRPRGPEQLAGTGLVVLNPPFTLEAGLSRLLPFLSRRLAQGPGAGWRLDWLR